MNPDNWEKYPGEKKLVGKDWTADLLEGDSISGVPTIDVAGDSTLTCVFQENDGNKSKFWLEHGEEGSHVPIVTLTIATTLGERLQDVIQVKILLD